MASANAPPPAAPARVTVDLTAMAANWKSIDAMSDPAVETAGVIKGDGYGLGLTEAAETLSAAGCATFFVATPQEGATARSVLPEAPIYVLDGLAGDAAGWMAENNLRPVLSSPAEAEVWRDIRSVHSSAQAAVQIDTGMNRLGFTPAEYTALGEESDLTDTLGIDLVMSHLACADEPEHALNDKQLVLFGALRRRVPGIRASLCNSAGVMLGAPYHFDLVRPGIALCGAAATIDPSSALQPVVTLEAKVLQVREAAAGETVGYGATRTLEKDARIAILGIGYADGYHRAVGTSEAEPRPRVSIRGKDAPLLGRVSMDLMAVDVTDIPEAERGDDAELFGPNVPVDEVAGHAGTIGYELLTSLGQRLGRLYTKGAS